MNYHCCMELVWFLPCVVHLPFICKWVCNSKGEEAVWANTVLLCCLLCVVKIQRTCLSLSYMYGSCLSFMYLCLLCLDLPLPHIYQNLKPGEMICFRMATWLSDFSVHVIQIKPPNFQTNKWPSTEAWVTAARSFQWHKQFTSLLWHWPCTCFLLYNAIRSM